MLCKCASLGMALHSSVFYVSVWADVCDRKPSLEPLAITTLCLDDSAGSSRLVVCGGGAFFSFFPSGPLHYSRDTYWALHFHVHLWHQARLANQSKRGEKKKQKNWKPAFKNSFRALCRSSLTLLFQLTEPEYFENFLSIIVGIFMCQLFQSKSKPILQLLKVTNAQHRHGESNAGIFFLPLAVLQLLPFCLAMRHTQREASRRLHQCLTAAWLLERATLALRVQHGSHTHCQKLKESFCLALL